MKKIFSLMLAILFAFSFTACKGKGTPKPNPETNSQTQSGADENNSLVDDSLQSDIQDSMQSDLQISQDVMGEIDNSAYWESVLPKFEDNVESDDSEQDTSESEHVHVWKPATCKVAKTCSVCKITEGRLGSHKYSDGKCVYCNKMNPALIHNQVESETYEDYINYRGYNQSLMNKKYGGALANTYNKLTTNEKLNVVYFGGSVTYGYGSENSDQKGSWRRRVGDWLTETFPEAKIKNINRAIGDTGSSLGLYRMYRNVIEQKPDLLFIEFSINDYYEGKDYSTASVQFETIVRNIKKALPECDIVTILVTDRTEAPAAHTTPSKAGELHTQAKAHELISEKYNISSIHVGRALSDEIFAVGNGTFNLDVWKEYVKDGVHPKNKGYDVYFNVIKEFLINSLFFGDCEECEIVKQKLPTLVNSKLLDGDVTYISESSSNVTFTTNNGTTHSPYGEGIEYGWDGDESKGIINFTKGSTDTVTVKFKGTELVMVLASGLTSSASFEVSIDGGKTWTTGYYTSKNPITVLKDLPAKEYTAIIKPAGNNAVSIDCFYSRNATNATKK